MNPPAQTSIHNPQIQLTYKDAHLRNLDKPA